MDRKSVMLFMVGGLIVALGLAFFVSPYASREPDGLERVSIDQGFANSAQDHALADGPLADYGVAGVKDEKLSTGLAGVIGVAVTFGVAMILFGVLRSTRARRGASDAQVRGARRP
jgi:cobalt/nickel transport system permease protein